MALSEEVIDEYKTSLKDLHVNSKPLINMLTMLAEDHEQHAPEIVKVIEDHINKCKPAKKLPVLYLMDSIMKNLGDSTNYKSLFSKNIVQTFTSVFEQVDEKTRASMYKLRQTWTSLLPNPKLYMIDVRINNLMDPAWPITASAPEKTSIHVNPKFLNKAGSSGSGSERSSPEAVFIDDEAEEEQETDQEAIMRQQLIAKHQELLELQQARIQLELAETQEKLKSFGKHGSKTGTSASSKIANLPLPPVVDDSDLSDPLWNPPQPIIDPRKKQPDPRMRDPRIQMQPYSTENAQEMEGTVSSTVPYMDQSRGQVMGGQDLPPQHIPHQDFNPMDSMQYPHGVPPIMQRGFGEGQNVFKGTVFPEDAKFSDSNDSDSSWSSFQDNRSTKSAIQPKVNVKDPRLRRQLQAQNKGNPIMKAENQGSTLSNKNRDPRRPIASKTSSGHQHKGTKDSRQGDKSTKDLQSSRSSGDNSSSKSPRKSSSDNQSLKSRSTSKDHDLKSITNQRDTFEAEKRKKDNDRGKDGEKDSKYLKKESGSRHSDRSSRSREKSPGHSSKHQSSKTSHHKGGGDSSSSGKSAHDSRNKDNSTKGASKKSESHSDNKRENKSADSKHVPGSARSNKREKSSPQGDEERFSKKPKLSSKEEPAAERSEMEVEQKSDVKVSNDLSDLFGSEDIDYRPVDQKGLPLKSPSSKGWDRYKASQPDQFAYDIELKKQRQDVDQRRTRQMSEASENQDTDLRLHGQGDTLLSPPIFERDIPKELSLSQHSEIIIQAQKQLREGKITPKQHQDLMQQVQELMQIQQKLQEENFQTNENTQGMGAGSISESPSRNLFHSLENEFKHQSPREDTNQATSQGFTAEGGPRSPERPMERFRIPKKSHDTDSPKKDKRGLHELYPERIKEEAWESGPPVLSREIDPHPQRAVDPEWIAPPNLNDNRRPLLDRRHEPRGSNFRRGDSSERLREHQHDYHKQHERRDQLEPSAMPHDLRDGPPDMKHGPPTDLHGRGKMQQYPHFDRHNRLDEHQPENLNVINDERRDHKLAPEGEKEIRNDWARSPRDESERRQGIGQGRLPDEKELQRFSDQKGPGRNGQERQHIVRDLCLGQDGMDFNNREMSRPNVSEKGLGHIEGPHIHPFDRSGPPFHRHEGPGSPPYGRPGPPHIEQNRQDPLRPSIERTIPHNPDLARPAPHRSELDQHDSEFGVNRVERGFDLNKKDPLLPDLAGEPLRPEFERQGPKRPVFDGPQPPRPEFDRSRPFRPNFERPRHKGPEINRLMPPGPEFEDSGYQGPAYDKMGSPRYEFDRIKPEGHDFDRQEFDRDGPLGPEYDRQTGHLGSEFDRSATQGPEFDRLGPPGPEFKRPGTSGPEFSRPRPLVPELDRPRLPSSDLDRERSQTSDLGRRGQPGPNFDRQGPLRPEYGKEGPPGPELDRRGPTRPDFDRPGPPRAEYDRPGAMGPEFDRQGPPRPEINRPGPNFDRHGPSEHEFDQLDHFKPEFDRQGHPGPDFGRHRLSGPEFDRHRHSGPDFDRQDHAEPDFDRQGPPGLEFDRLRSGRLELQRKEFDRLGPPRQDEEKGPFRSEFDEHGRAHDGRYGPGLDRHRGPPRHDLDGFHEANEGDVPPLDTHRHFEPHMEDENRHRERFDRQNRVRDQDRYGRRDEFDPEFDRFKHDNENNQFRSYHDNDQEFDINEKHGRRRHDERYPEKLCDKQGGKSPPRDRNTLENRNRGDKRIRDEDVDKSKFAKAQENKKNESATGGKVPKGHKDNDSGKADAETDFNETVLPAFDPNKGLPPWRPVDSPVNENAKTIDIKGKKDKPELRDEHAKKVDRGSPPLLKDRSQEDRLLKKESKERLPSILDGIEPDLLAKQHKLEDTVSRTRPTVPEGRFNPMPSQLLGIPDSPNKKDHRGPVVADRDERRGPGRQDKEEKRGKKDKDGRRVTDRQDRDDRRGQDRPGKGDRRGQGRPDKDDRRGPGRPDKDERRGLGRSDKDERRGPLPPQEVMDGYIDKYGDPRFRSFTDMGPEVSEEVVFGKRNYEIKLGAPPRKIQWGNGFIEVYADPSKRGVVIDNELMYRFGERVKEVNIRGKREKIFYHGKPLDIWIDGNNYEVRVDSPPKTLIINNQAHRIQVDGRDMMILIDKAEMGPYGGEPRFILIDDMRMELRFDPPPRHILIDGEMCELKLNVRQPCINIKGVLHGIRFKGPPRDLFINGSCYQVFTDHAVKLRVGNRFHYVALGGPCHELIVDGKWYEVKFDEPPKEINVGNRVLMVRIPGGPPEVMILDPIPLESAHMPMFNPGPLRMPMPGQPMISGPRPMGPPQQPMIPGMPGMMIGQPVSGPNPMVNPVAPGLQPPMGPPQTSVVPGIRNIIPGLQPSQPNPLPMSSVGPTSGMPNVLSGLFQARPALPATTTSAPAGGLDINSLLSKLVSSGIIKKEPETKQPIPTSTVMTPAPPTKTDNSTIVAEAIKAAAAVKRKPVVTRNLVIPDKTSFDLVDLKEFHEGAIQRLYAGAQCTSCGARFSLDNDDKADRYKQHLDWHFRQNKLKKDDTKVARCRKWYYGVGDWIQYEEVTDLEDQSKSVFFEQQNPAQPVTPSQSQQIALITVPEGASVVKCPPATGNDQDDLCNICHEPFEQFWHEEHEEWHLREAIRVNNKTYHPICYEDYTDVSEGTPSPSVLLDKQPDFSSRKTLSYEESSQDSVPHSSFEEERKVPNTSLIKTEPVMSLEGKIKSEPQTVNTDIKIEGLATVKMEVDPEFSNTSAFSSSQSETSVKQDSGSDSLISGLSTDQYGAVKQEPVEEDEAQGSSLFSKSNFPKSAIPGFDVSVSKSEQMETSEEKFVSDREISTAGQESIVTVNSSVSDASVKMESEGGDIKKADSVESNQMDTADSSVGESADIATPTLDEDNSQLEHIEGPAPFSHPSKSLITEQTSPSVLHIAEKDGQSVSQIQNTDTKVETQTLGAPVHHSSTLSPLKHVLVSQPADVIEISQEVLEISSNASTPTHDELPSPPSPGS